MKTYEEIINQGVALSLLAGDDMENIQRYAARFRGVVEGFKEKYGRVPTADEIIYCVSYDVHFNIRKGREDETSMAK